MTVYYFQPADLGKISVFQKVRASTYMLRLSWTPWQGFRMIAGNAMARSRDIDQNLAEYSAYSFRCWEKNFGGDIGFPGLGPNDTPYLPNRPCAGGIRANIYFPSWVFRDGCSRVHLANVLAGAGMAWTLTLPIIRYEDGCRIWCTLIHDTEPYGLSCRTCIEWPHPLR